MNPDDDLPADPDEGFEGDHVPDPASQADGRDPLTGLSDHHGFLQRLPLMVAQAQGEAEAVGLIMLDLDWFGETDQRLGRAVGDRLLRAVGNRMRGTRGAILAARFDGDDFVVMVRGVGGSQSIADIAAGLVDTVREPFQRGAASVRLTASAGSATFPGDALSATGLLRRAETALFYAKNSGRDRALRYERSMRMDLAATVRASVGQGNFLLHYQPVMALPESGRIAGIEALMRWQHPQRGLLHPGAFRALFENPEVAIALGTTALDGALAEYRWLANRRLDCGRLTVNLSAAQLRWPDLAEQVAGLLLKHAVEGERLVLDLPDDNLVDEPADSVADKIGHLREIGVGLGFNGHRLDSGVYAGCLRPGDWFRLALDHGDDGRVGSEVIALNARARAAGAEVVLDRVERRDQLRRATMMGAAAAQGFAIARPMAASDLPEFITSLAGGSRRVA